MTAPEITVVGSVNVDLVVDVGHVPLVGETVLGGDLRRIPGGKGANQAVAAARLERRVAMVGRAGDDEGGIMIRAALDEAGVHTTALVTTPQTPSGVALIAVQSDGDNSIVVSPGANARLNATDIGDAGSLVSEAAVVLLQLEIPVEAVSAAARAATGTVILNPAPAPADALPADLMNSVDIMVPNQTELASLTGHEGDVDATVAARLARSLAAPVVIVTLGADGAIVVTERESTHIAAPVVTPVDTTAAGDSFCGALADALVRGASLVDAVRWAVRVGAATTRRPGAQPSLPTPVEVEQLLS
jgi:ribokinase